jgi:hypothetical protein
MITIPDSYATLTCGRCQHEADFFDFCSTPITGELPRDTHQCPKCRTAWHMEITEPGHVTRSGFFIPPTRKAVQIPTIL